MILSPNTTIPCRINLIILKNMFGDKASRASLQDMNFLKKSKILRVQSLNVEFTGGGGIMAFAKLCAGFDLLGFDRKVIGFDTFEGFPHLSEEDKQSVDNKELKVGGFQSFMDIEKELQDCIKEFDENRFINQFDKVQLIKGDACQTIPQYIEENPQTLISLLYLDFDLYEPTKVALEHLAPRVVKGGIIVFDEINEKAWKGETIAAFEYFGNFNQCKLQTFDFVPAISYMVVE